jgi:predicted acylesterase/phospholipase RssA
MRPHFSPAGDSPLELLLARAAQGSRPGRRADQHCVALVVEGGGMRGAVAAGMCLALEEAGLMASFDRVYGCSSGAITGCYAAAGQAALWASSFEDSACREFIDPSRAFRGGPMVDLDFLFDDVIARRRPLSAAGLAAGPEFRAVAVSATRGELRVLGDFENVLDVLGAMRASCSIPVVSGAPKPYRGEPMVDGGLLEPIPFHTAVREGATHILVLRSREASHRPRRQDRLAERVLARAYPELGPLLASCSWRYDRDAAELDRLGRKPGTPRVQQLTVAPGSRLVPRFTIDVERIAATIRLGVATMAAALDDAIPLAA